METIYHVAFASDWAAAQREGSYRMSTRGADLATVGFVHGSFLEQVDGILRLLYSDVTEPLVVLVIDPRRLDAEVRVENLDGGDVLFPHVYGPIPADAVVATLAVAPPRRPKP